MARTLVEIYNWLWPETWHPLELEFECIRRGGFWPRKDGKTAGKGLFHHFKKAAEIIWPEFRQHRWFDTNLDAYLSHEWIGVAGGKDTTKTGSFTVILLLDYYPFASCTSIILSSTTMEALDNRVFAEFKMRHRAARNRINWLPGHLIEGRRRIVTDNHDEFAEGRDFRNGVLCFVTGSLVDTPSGPVPIESLKIGDLVLNAIGTGRVKETFSRMAKCLIRVHLSDGRTLDCTKEHPFFTQRGWIKAIDLQTSDMVFSADETMRLMREPTAAGLSEPKILRCWLPRFFTGTHLQAVRKIFSSLEPKTLVGWAVNRQFLQPCLCGPVGYSKSFVLRNSQYSVQKLPKADGGGSPQQTVLLSFLPATFWPAPANPLSSFRPPHRPPAAFAV